MPRERGSSCFFAMLGEPSLELRSDCADVATLNAVSAYLPRSLISHLSSGQVQVPERHRCKAALAFVDVSGFTKLSLALEKEHGPEGAEKLQLFINSYFHRLIRSVLFHGGDILKFAGDAFLVVSLFAFAIHSSLFSDPAVSSISSRTLERREACM